MFTFLPYCLSEHVAPPKKPPRPGAQSQVSACLNTADSYNDGVKVTMVTSKINQNINV